MANSQFTDANNHNAHASNQAPIMLARLPRVGAEQPIRAASPAPIPSAPAQTAPAQTTMPAASLPMTPPPAPSPEAVPSIALRDQIEQRIQLQIANTPTDVPAAATTRFVDQNHTPAPPEQALPESMPVEPNPTLVMPAVKEAKRRSASQHRSPAPRAPALHRLPSSDEPKTLSGKLFQLNSSLAPHAGLIVTLALIASAGLLYWMIVGPTQSPAASLGGSGLESSRGGIGITSSTMPIDYQPNFARTDAEQSNSEQSKTQLSNTTQANMVQAKAVQTPAARVQADISVATQSDANAEWVKVPLSLAEQPLVKQPAVVPVFDTVQALPVNAGLQFPTTGNPGKLDFSKLGKVVVSPVNPIATRPQPSTDAPQVQPELARRPITSTNR